MRTLKWGVSRLPWQFVPSLAWLFAGCFSEPAVVGEDGAAETSGGSCEEGALGCVCHRDGSCAPGLNCDPGALACIPHACTPGTRACTCAAGVCDAPLACEAGLCVDTTPNQVDGSSSDDSGAGTSGGSSTTTGDTLTPGSSDSSDSSGGAQTDGSSTEGSPIDCDAMDCATCLGCAGSDVGPCDDEIALCEATAGCVSAVNCLNDCGTTGLCFEDCCMGLNASQLDAVDGAMFCLKDACTSACAAYEIPVCG